MAVIEGFVPGKRDWDRISSTVRGWESGLPPEAPGKRPLPDRDFIKVKFRNNSGEAVPAKAPMRITSVEDDEGVRRFVIAKPNTTFQRIYLVNAGEEVAIGAPGWGTFLTCRDEVLYNDANTPAFGEEWGPVPSTWKVAQHRPGFFIWGGASGGSTDLVLAQQILAQSVLGKADAAIAHGASGTVRVYSGTPGSEADTSQTIASCYNHGPDIADEALVTVQWLHGKPYVWLAACEEA